MYIYSNYDNMVFCTMWYNGSVWGFQSNMQQHPSEPIWTQSTQSSSKQTKYATQRKKQIIICLTLAVKSRKLTHTSVT